MKQEFIDFLNTLMAAAPEVEMNDNVKAYIDALMNDKTEKPVMTDNGKVILDYMQKHPETPMLKARDIAEGLFIGSRAVSGAIRKLVNDGYVERVGSEPTIYSITEKGKNFIIE